jgi:ribosome-associated heat shock protein Hsp15
MAVNDAQLGNVRLDKWLWAARFFKTRSLAARACELGRITYGNQAVKASREVKVGDRLEIRTASGDFHIDVLALSGVRGPASIAQKLYSETESSRAARIKIAQERKALMNFSPAPEGRPSKRDRRKIMRFRGQR